MSDEKMMPFTKGKKFWIEIQATEDGAIEECKELGNLVFKNRKIDSFEITQFILKESFFSTQALREIQEFIQKKLDG